MILKLYFKNFIFLLTLVFFIIFNFQIVKSIENKIEFKVNNEIISTIDIDNEKKFLISLNPRLLELSDNKLHEISIESAIKEKIKKIEIKKYKNEIEIEENYLAKLVEDNYRRIDFKSQIEFEDFLKSKGLKLNEFKKKITIEALWNEIIYKKYFNKVNIDKKKLRDEISKLSEKKFDYSYDLSEIIFNLDVNLKLNEKIEIIKKDIEDKGFENAASIYSISSSSNLGGKLGWVKAAQINEKIRLQIMKLNVGEITEPVVIPGGFLILKLNNLKKNKKKINIENELQKIIRLKTNQQLNQFSNIYFNKIKKDIKIEKI